MFKLDVPEGLESLVPISLFVWKKLGKNERGTLNSPAPPRQARVNAFCSALFYIFFYYFFQFFNFVEEVVIT